MDQDDERGSEESREARQHVRNAHENAEALAEQARRVQASAPEGTGRPVQGLHVPGTGGEDDTRAAAHQRQARENADAMEEQARRTETGTPDDTDGTGPRNE